MKFIFSILILSIALTSSSQITPNSQFTWIKGDSVANKYTIGNLPGGRDRSMSWLDASKNLWLLGGYGFGLSAGGYLNDLWKYDPAANSWTFMKGSTSVNQNGNYGTMGTASSANSPGGRRSGVSWVDGSGNFWLFGGDGYPATGSSWGTPLNDLWKYNPGSNQWTWVGGSNSSLTSSTYGLMGVPNTTNMPGARMGSASWKDLSGNFWLFGGWGMSSNLGYLNDLWKYNVTTNMWTWVKGDTISDQLGVYGIKGIPDINNTPSARQDCSSWVDNSGNLWLFGGGTNSYYSSNDLWKYDILTNQWTWMNGDSLFNAASVYGVQGIPDILNKPGGREGASSLKDVNGNFWLFGGQNNLGQINELWKYDPNINQWLWIIKDTLGAVSSVYGTKGIASSTNKVGSRFLAISWTDGNNFWYLGGTGYAAHSDGYLNDLWKLNKDPFVWTGTISTNWTVGNNWSGGVVPGLNDNVTVPSGTPFSATVPTGVTVSVRSLTITIGAQVTVGTNAHLNVTH